MKLSKEIKTGLIAVVGIVLFISGYSYLKSLNIFDNSKTFYAVYDNVAGLQNGTQVYINGLDVGKVQDIRFLDARGQKLLVTLSINTTVEFSKKSEACINGNLLGSKWVEVHPVFDSDPPAKAGDTLKAKVIQGLTDKLPGQIEGVTGSVDSLMTNFNTLLDLQTKKDLQESIAKLKGTIDSYGSTANSLNSLLEDNQEDITASVKNFRDISANFKSLSDSLNQAGLPETMKQLQTTVAQLNGILAKIEQGEGSLGKLAQDEELYNNLNSATRELDLLLQDFRLNPKRYVNVSVFGKKQKEYTLPEDDPAENKN